MSTPTRTQTASVRPPAARAVTVEPTPAPDAMRSVVVEATYYQRILLPENSPIVVTFKADGIDDIVVNSLTKSGPPYAIDLPLPNSWTGTATVTVMLDALSGHKYEGSVELTERPEGPIQIVMSPSSARESQ